MAQIVNFKFFQFSILFLFLVLAGPAWAGHAEIGDDPIEPFVTAGPLPDRDLPAEAIAGSGRFLSLRDAGGFRDHSWSITVPGAGLLVADRTQQRDSYDGDSVTWVGSVRGAAGGLVTITMRDGAISGFLDDGNRYWVIEGAAQGLYRLYELDTRLTPPPAAPIGGAEVLGSGEATTSEVQAAGATVIQDLLVAYSPEVTTRYGGVAATETAIANHVAAINQSYVNSQVDIQLSLVGTIELAQSQSGDMGTTLSRLRQTSDGYYDEVHPLRDLVGADLVAMLSTETGYCGVGYLPHPQNAGMDAYAFSVTSAYSGYACLPLTLGHEVGHNQGLCHNREESGCTNPAYPYGFGRLVCGTFRTIMSYSCPAGATRVYNFANPNVFHAGLPTGIADADDPTNSSEAWRALNDSALDVANWRGCSVLDPPIVPDMVSVLAVSQSQIDVTWTDNSDNESGFNVERSTDNQNWVKIASVGDNAGMGGTVVYADGGLSAETTYWYRVQSHNCQGASDYSETGSAMTDLVPPQPPVAPSAVSASVDASGTVSVSWDTVAGATEYEVGRADKTGRGNKWSAIAALGFVTAPPFVDVPGAGTYRYYVRAHNASGVSAWSSHAQVKVSGGSDGGGGPDCTKRPNHPKC